MRKIWQYAKDKKPFEVDLNELEIEIKDDILFVKYKEEYILKDVELSFDSYWRLESVLLYTFLRIIDDMLIGLEFKPRTLKLLRNCSRYAEETTEPKLVSIFWTSEDSCTVDKMDALLSIMKQSYYEKWGWINQDMHLDLRKHYNLFKSDKVDLFKLCLIIEAANKSRTSSFLDELESCISTDSKRKMAENNVRASERYK